MLCTPGFWHSLSETNQQVPRDQPGKAAEQNQSQDQHEQTAGALLVGGWLIVCFLLDFFHFFEVVALEAHQRRLEFLGTYHSHPNWLDTNEPSPKDIALAHYSVAIYFIVTPRPYATTPIRAFSIRDGRAMELEIQVLP